MTASTNSSSAPVTSAPAGRVIDHTPDERAVRRIAASNSCSALRGRSSMAGTAKTLLALPLKDHRREVERAEQAAACHQREDHVAEGPLSARADTLRGRQLLSQTSRTPIDALELRGALDADD